MGLAERRAAKEFETNRFPALKKDLDGAAGFDVPVEIKWETLAVDDYSAQYDEYWTKVYFRPLIDALKAITVDAMGKEALQGGLKKIIVQNTKGNYTADYMPTFEKGVLTLDHEAASNVDYVEDRKKAIQKILEKAL